MKGCDRIKYDDDFLNSVIDECKQSGLDRYIAVDDSQKLVHKCYDELLSSDTIYSKVTLVWREGCLDYRLINYSEPFIISEHLDKYDALQSFDLIYLVKSKLFTFNKPSNNKRFDSVKMAMSVFLKYRKRDMADRLALYGVR